MDALRANFLAPLRPVALTAGSRALVRVVDDLQWFFDRVTATPANCSGRSVSRWCGLRDCAQVLLITRAAREPTSARCWPPR